MAGKITVEYTESDLIQLILEDLSRKMPGVNVEKRNIAIETKSKQNYKAEWERAAFRSKVEISGSLL